MFPEDRTVDEGADKMDSVASIFLIAGRRLEVGFEVVDRAMVVQIVVVVKEIRAVVAMNTARGNII